MTLLLLQIVLVLLMLLLMLWPCPALRCSAAISLAREKRHVGALQPGSGFRATHAPIVQTIALRQHRSEPKCAPELVVLKKDAEADIGEASGTSCNISGVPAKIHRGPHSFRKHFRFVLNLVSSNLNLHGLFGGQCGVSSEDSAKPSGLDFRDWRHCPQLRACEADEGQRVPELRVEHVLEELCAIQLPPGAIGAPAALSE
mmetsp:Transcript_57699/g.165486  ORF Transcript_57699/g.165486 Transcript_57699/m.165486 type:complete len:201 (-) Transcript_57699:1602-2204(-)